MSVSQLACVFDCVHGPPKTVQIAFVLQHTGVAGLGPGFKSFVTTSPSSRSKAAMKKINDGVIGRGLTQTSPQGNCDEELTDPFETYHMA
mmetsp:Transcript_54977/g.103257  ORF Transcript_54977/g.103257 Transcript_54977/m.103257 type:complete len:90 (-) Transcript_54977:2-271(-)